MGREAIHVGEHIIDQLEAMQMTPAAFAKKLKVPTKTITELINGHRDLDGDMALRLGHFFGTGPRIWLSLQNLYEIRLAEAKIGKIVKTLPKLKQPKLPKLNKAA